jgi:hypothetical protein
MMIFEIEAWQHTLLAIQDHNLGIKRTLSSSHGSVISYLHAADLVWTPK